MNELFEICQVLKTLPLAPYALATVIRVEGSSYRKPGARLLTNQAGQSWGMISGGCLEHDILEQAKAVMKTGVPRIVRYDSTASDDIVFGTGLGCNGIIDVFVEPVTELLRQILTESVERCQQTRHRGAIATRVAGVGMVNPLERHAFMGPAGWEGDDFLKTQLGDNGIGDASAVISFNIMGGTATVFVQPLLPCIQLVAFGGWLDVLPLIRMAKDTGWQVYVVDARCRESSRKYFKEADAILLCSAQDALSQIQFDDRTAAVLMNHSFEHDREGLEALSSVRVRFVGMLGPRSRKERLFEAAKRSGSILATDFQNRIRGPVGLDIGAQNPQEIALAIVAEILAVMNGRTAQPARDQVLRLHGPAPALTYA